MTNIPVKVVKKFKKTKNNSINGNPVQYFRKFDRRK